jgi:7-cyano-7-deazaguanine synthase in queuosine biosynthesis
MERPDTLIMFSGGLDSTGVFWRLIHGSDELHVHHLYLVNKENRAEAENRAVKDIVSYMRRIRNFSFSESYHEYPCYNGGFLWDSDMFSFVAGSICLSLPTIKKVAVGVTASDIRPSLSQRMERSQKIFGAFGTKAEKVFPLTGMTKKEIFAMLPEELRSMTWSCRTPVYKEKEIIPCGRCKACGEIRHCSR